MSDSTLMSKEETRALFNDLKADFKDSMVRIESKIDVATENINKYAKDTIEHNVRISNIEKDVDNLGGKVRFVQRYAWATTGAISVIIFLLNYTK